MDTVIKISVLSILVSTVILTIKKQSPQIATILGISVIVLVFGLVGGAFTTITGFIQDVAAIAGIAPQVLSALMKAVGIAIVTKIAADIARDCGESGIASTVELAGTVIALTFTLPVFMVLIKMF